MDISSFRPFLTVKDHSVSHEEFSLLHNVALDMLATFPQPKEDKLASYYESADYISHTDAKRSMFEKAYHLIKSFALKGKLKLINQHQKEKGALLDIGAGTGDFLKAASNDGWRTVGVEPSEKARIIAESKGISFAPNTAQLLNASFDVITMWHVLEHVPDIEKQIAELKRLLKPDGTIFIAVPNFKSYDAKHYGEYWAAYDVPRHLWHFSKSAIKILFEREKLQLKNVLPMPFDAFYVSLLSEKYKSGTMNYFNAFNIGLRSNFYGRRKGEYSSHIYVLKNG